MAHLVKYINGNEGIALYIDGNLDKIGDDILINKRIAEFYQVDEREGDYTCGTDDYSKVPKTLTELEDFIEEAEQANIDQKKLQRLRELEVEAEKLRNELKLK